MPPAAITPEAPAHHAPVHDTWLMVHGTPAPRAPASPRPAAAQPPPRPLARRTLASQLEQARVAAQLTPAELARLAGLAVADIDAIEAGEMRFPPATAMERLAAALGVTLAAD